MKLNIIRFLHAFLLILSCSLLSFCKSETQTNYLILKKSNETPISSFISFSNQSSWENPGFIRCPLLEIHDDANVFISKTNTTNFKNIAVRDKAELFYSGDTHIPYILKENDTILIKDYVPKNIYILSSSKEERNNEINFFQSAYINKIPLLYVENSNQQKKLIDKNEVTNNFTRLRGYYTLAKNFKETYFQNFKVSLDFKNFIEEYIRFDHYIKIFTYLNNKESLDSLIKHKYFDFNSDTLNIYHNCNYALQGALYQFTKFSFNLNTNKIDFENIFPRLGYILNKQNASLIKYIFLKNFTSSNEAFKIKKSKLNILNKSIENIAYQNVITGYLKDNEFSDKFKNKIINLQGNVFTLENIISKFKGKVVLVDFWASWCAPCRKEFEYYPNLRTLLDTGKIKFIFISIDKSKEAWIKAINDETHITASENFLLVNTSKDILETMNLSSIPRYYLYSEKGILISNDAPYPSEKKLVIEINNLILKK